MGCIYEDREGVCTLADVNLIEEDKVCHYSDDPDPSYSCDAYESDYVCIGCNVDLNSKECICEN